MLNNIVFSDTKASRFIRRSAHAHQNLQRSRPHRQIDQSRGRWCCQGSLRQRLRKRSIPTSPHHSPRHRNRDRDDRRSFHGLQSRVSSARRSVKAQTLVLSLRALCRRPRAIAGPFSFIGETDFTDRDECGGRIKNYGSESEMILLRRWRVRRATRSFLAQDYL